MDKNLLKEIIVSGLTRHATQALGGAFVATGIGNESNAAILVGVGMNALAFGWSAWRKKRRARKLNKQEK